jgi:hypothetical protein
MQKYIDQLLEDIEAAMKPVDRNKEPQSLQDHFREIEKLVAMGEPEYDLSFYCGLREQQFPASDLLSTKQLKALFKALSKMIVSYNVSVLIPKSVPLREAYSLLISTLNKKVYLVEFGSVVIEFCSEEPSHCPLKKHCLCGKRKKVKEDDAEDELKNQSPALN